MPIICTRPVVAWLVTRSAGPTRRAGWRSVRSAARERCRHMCRGRARGRCGPGRCILCMSLCACLLLPPLLNTRPPPPPCGILSGHGHGHGQGKARPRCWHHGLTRPAMPRTWRTKARYAARPPARLGLPGGRGAQRGDAIRPGMLDDLPWGEGYLRGVGQQVTHPTHAGQRCVRTPQPQARDPAEWRAGACVATVSAGVLPPRRGACCTAQRQCPVPHVGARDMTSCVRYAVHES